MGSGHKGAVRRAQSGLVEQFSGSKKSEESPNTILKKATIEFAMDKDEHNQLMDYASPIKNATQQNIAKKELIKNRMLKAAAKASTSSGEAGKSGNGQMLTE